MYYFRVYYFIYLCTLLIIIIMDAIIGYNVYRIIDNSKHFVGSFSSKDEAIRYCRSRPVSIDYLIDHPNCTGYFIIPVVRQVGQLSLNL